MPESPSPFPDDKLPLHRRPWVVMGAITALLLGVLVYVFFKDDPPPDDADLLPVFTPGGGPDNPLAVFCREVGDRAISGYDRLPIEACELRRGQEKAIREFVQNHEGERQMLHDLMQTDPTKWDWVQERGVENGRITWNRCGYVAFVCKAYATLLARSGISAESTEEALLLAKFGHLLQMLPGEIQQLELAMSIQSLGEELLRECLAGCDDPHVLKRIQEILTSLEPDRQRLIAAAKVDYLRQKEWIAKLDRGHPDWKWIVSLDPPTAAAWLLPNRTVGMDAAWLRPVVEGLGHDWASGLSAVEHSSREARALQRSRLRMTVSANRCGNMAIALLWTRKDEQIGRVVTRVALHRMAIISLALRRYELEHGRAPDHLEELAPAFILTVPSDPFDNQPLRWDAARKRLYSTGENHADDHGDDTFAELSDRVDWHTHGQYAPLDIVMPYWWLAEPDQK